MVNELAKALENDQLKYAVMTKLKWVSASKQVVTPRCRLLTKKCAVLGNKCLLGPIHNTKFKKIKASVENVLIPAVIGSSPTMK